MLEKGLGGSPGDWTYWGCRTFADDMTLKLVSTADSPVGTRPLTMSHPMMPSGQLMFLDTPSFHGKTYLIWQMQWPRSMERRYSFGGVSQRPSRRSRDILNTSSNNRYTSQLT